MLQSSDARTVVTRAEAGEVRAAQAMRNFWAMSVAFAVNHGTVTTPLVVASTLLGKEIADFGNGALYAVTLLSSLFLAAPMSASLGSKGGLIFGMSLYCVYVASFSAATVLKDVEALAWLFFVSGSCCGGLAAGVLWTAQGGYFAHTATELAEATGESRMAVTAALAGKFAFVYLALEVASKLGFSALQSLQWEAWQVGLLYLLFGLASVAAMTRVRRFEVAAAAVPAGKSAAAAKVLAAASLWSDPAIWLLAPTNLTFGFSAAYMGGHVNAEFASKELGPAVIGVLAAITASVAAVMAQLLGPLARRTGKGPVIVLGAASFLTIPLLLLGAGCCQGWGWWLMVLYVLQGIGRAVYESTNRATFSDFFPGDKTEGAFANCMLQSSLAFALCFFLQAYLSGETLAKVVMVLACLTPTCYGAAVLLQRHRQAKANEALLGAAELGLATGAAAAAPAPTAGLPSAAATPAERRQ